MKSRNGINNHPPSRKGVANRIVTQNNQAIEKKTEKYSRIFVIGELLSQ